MREIILSINNNRITSSTDFAGYKGEHNATYLKFELPDELKNPNYTYQANIALPNSITTTATLTDMTLPLTSILTACEGVIQVQLVITENSTFVYKSGVTTLKIKQSLAPTAVIGSGSGIENVVVNEEGYLIITLSGGKEINAGYIKGDKGEAGNTYTLSETDKQEVADKLSNDIIRGIIEHNIPALEIPDGTIKISDYQFQDNSDLRKVVVPDSVETVGNYSFQNCFKMTGIDLKGVKEIGIKAFYGCYSLTDAESFESVETIGTSAFENCYSLQKEDLNLSSCKYIGDAAFLNCKFTGKLNLSNCEQIVNRAFWGSSFTTIILSGKLTTLPIANFNPFATCTNLKFVDLGKDFNCNNLVLSMADLPVETMIGVFISLKDRTGETPNTLILGSKNLLKLNDEQKTIAIDKNWVLA